MQSLARQEIEYYLAAQPSSDAPSVEPIETTDVMGQVYASTDDDLLIDAYITAARQLVENTIPGGRSLINQTRILYLDSFPSGDDPMPLPFPPLQSVTSIGYFDTSGSTQTMASTDYTVHTPGKSQGFVVPLVNTTWPSAQDRRDGVVVTYVAGYGSTRSDVPQSIRQAMRLLCGHWYANRESVLTGTVSKEIELGFRSLLSTEDWGFYG